MYSSCKINKIIRESLLSRVTNYSLFIEMVTVFLTVWVVKSISNHCSIILSSQLLIANDQMIPGVIILFYKISQVSPSYLTLDSIFSYSDHIMHIPYY